MLPVSARVQFDELLRTPRRASSLRQDFCRDRQADPRTVPPFNSPLFWPLQRRAVGLRRYAPLFPAFFELPVDEMHLEMASREFAEVEMICEIAEQGTDVAVGIIDVKSYYIETPGDVAERVRLCLKYAPAEKLSFAPDCGLSQTARWAARQKLANMVSGVSIVRRELGLS